MSMDGAPRTSLDVSRKPRVTALKPRRRLAVWLAILLSPVAIFLVTQCCCFPTTGSVRAMIEEADRVEVRKFFMGYARNGVDVAVLADARERHRLAESLELTGWWLPFDELIANSYRIRVVRGEQITDLTLRGDLLRVGGSWHARIDGSVFGAIRELSREQGRRWPTAEELLGKQATQPAGQGATSFPSDPGDSRQHE